jgi:hypothetical protein
MPGGLVICLSGALLEVYLVRVPFSSPSILVDEKDGTLHLDEGQRP